MWVTSPSEPPRPAVPASAAVSPAGVARSSGEHAPLVSVVISTRNRAVHLPDALRAHERIVTSVPWELIVVNNGSTDDTADVLERIFRDTSLRTRTVVEPTPGLSRARNAGWRAARGAIVAFTDDDCYPAVDYIDQVTAVFEDPAIGYMGGRILLHDPSDFPVTILTSEVAQSIPPRTIVQAGAIQGANMAARREVLERVGGFDDDLGAGTRFPSEDVEFACQASFAGVTGVYDPRPVVRHHHRRKTDVQVQALRRGYAFGRGAYHAKCLMDPARRVAALKTYYWRARAVPLAARLRRSYFRERAQELAGALAFLNR